MSSPDLIEQKLLAALQFAWPTNHAPLPTAQWLTYRTTLLMVLRGMRLDIVERDSPTNHGPLPSQKSWQQTLAEAPDFPTKRMRHGT